MTAAKPSRNDRSQAQKSSFYFRIFPIWIRDIFRIMIKQNLDFFLLKLGQHGNEFSTSGLHMALHRWQHRSISLKAFPRLLNRQLYFVISFKSKINVQVTSSTTIPTNKSQHATQICFFSTLMCGDVGNVFRKWFYFVQQELQLALTSDKFLHLKCSLLGFLCKCRVIRNYSEI